MTAGAILEAAIAFALIVTAVILYRRRGRDDPNHGSQTAVLLLVLGAIMAIHAFGGLDYRPSPSESAQ